MAGPNDFTNQNIQDTYQRVLQTDGQNIFDGTGSAFNLTNDISITASHAQQAVTASHALFAISASHEITHELSTSYSQTADSASNDFNINNDLNFITDNPNFNVAGTNMIGLSAGAGQIRTFQNIRTSNDRGINFGTNTDYGITHNNSATTLLFKEGNATKLTMGVGGHFTGSSGVNFKLLGSGKFIGDFAEITNITGSHISASTEFYTDGHVTASGNISASGYVLTNELRGSGDDVSLNVLGTITASSHISSSGNIYASNVVLSNNGMIAPGENHQTIKFMTKPPGTSDNGERFTLGPDLIEFSGITGDDTNYSLLKMDMTDGAEIVIFNATEQDVDFKIHSDNTTAMIMNAGHDAFAFRDHVGIGYDANKWPTSDYSLTGTFDKQLMVSGLTHLTGSVEIIGPLSVTGNISASGVLYVNHISTGSGELTENHISITGSTSVFGNVTASGNISISESLTFGAAASEINFPTELKIGVEGGNDYIRLVDNKIELRAGNSLAVEINDSSNKISLGYAGIDEVTIGSSGTTAVKHNFATSNEPLHSQFGQTKMGKSGDLGSTSTATLFITGSGHADYAGTALEIEGNTISSGEVSASSFIISGSSGSVLMKTIVGHDGIGNGKLFIQPEAINESGVTTAVEQGTYSLFVASSSGNTRQLIYSDTGHSELQFRASQAGNGFISFNENGATRYLIGTDGATDSFQIRDSNFMTGGSSLLRIHSGSGFDAGISFGPTGSGDLSRGYFHVTASGNISSSGTILANSISITNNGHFGSITLDNRLNANQIGSNGNVGNTEYGRLDGVTSNIQTQFDGIGSKTGSYAITGSNVLFGNITATDLSASGVVYTNHISTGSGEIAENYISITGSTSVFGNVTASGNMSVGGNIDLSNTKAFTIDDTGGTPMNVANINGSNILTFGDNARIAHVDGTVISLDSAGTIFIDSDNGDVQFQDNAVTSIKLNTTAGHISASGNISASNIYSSGEISSSGKIYSDNEEFKFISFNTQTNGTQLANTFYTPTTKGIDSQNWTNVRSSLGAIGKVAVNTGFTIPYDCIVTGVRWIYMANAGTPTEATGGLTFVNYDDMTWPVTAGSHINGAIVSTNETRGSFDDAGSDHFQMESELSVALSANSMIFPAFKFQDDNSIKARGQCILKWKRRKA